MRVVSKEKLQQSKDAAGIDYKIRKQELEPLSREGDMEAFIKLLKLYEQEFKSLAYRYLKDVHLAEDAVNASYEKAWKKFGDFRGGSETRTWLYRIVCNTCKNMLLSRAKRPEISLTEDSDSDIISGIEFKCNNPDRAQSLSYNSLPEDAVDADRMRVRLLEKFNEMSDAHREVLVLREVDGLSYEGIAKEMEIPIGTVRSRLFFAREILAEVADYDRQK